MLRQIVMSCCAGLASSRSSLKPTTPVSGPSTRRRPRGLAVVSLAVPVVDLAVATAVWAPRAEPARAEARPTLAQVKAQVERLDHQAEQAAERYNAAREGIKGLMIAATDAGDVVKIQPVNNQNLTAATRL